MFTTATRRLTGAQTAAVPAARRHALLLYDRLYSAWRAPALLISGLFFLLWQAAPAPLNAEPLHSALLAGALAALLLFIYSLLAARLSYVECTPTHLRLSTPFFWLAISYSRIRIQRSVAFKPGRVPFGKRGLVRPLIGETMVAVDLFNYPVSRHWLRLWLMEFILPTRAQGLQFLVSDWMALSRDIEVGRSLWQARERDKARQMSLTSLLQPRRF